MTMETLISINRFSSIKVYIIKNPSVYPQIYPQLFHLVILHPHALLVTPRISDGPAPYISDGKAPRPYDHSAWQKTPLVATMIFTIFQPPKTIINHYQPLNIMN